MPKEIRRKRSNPHPEHMQLMGLERSVYIISDSAKKEKENQLNNNLAIISQSLFSIDASDLAVFEAVRNSDRTVKEIRQKINKDFKEMSNPAREKAKEIQNEIDNLPKIIKVENSEEVSKIENDVKDMSLKVIDLKIKIGEAKKEKKKEEIKKITNPITDLDIEL